MPCWLETCRISFGSDGITELKRTQNVVCFPVFCCCSVAKSSRTLLPHGLQPTRLWWAVFHYLPLSSTVSWSLIKLMSFEPTMLSHILTLRNLGSDRLGGLFGHKTRSRWHSSPQSSWGFCQGITMQEPCCQNSIAYSTVLLHPDKLNTTGVLTHVSSNRSVFNQMTDSQTQRPLSFSVSFYFLFLRL